MLMNRGRLLFISYVPNEEGRKVMPNWESIDDGESLNTQNGNLSGQWREDGKV